MKDINLSKIKQSAIAVLALSSCGFALWTAQNSVLASTTENDNINQHNQSVTDTNVNEKASQPDLTDQGNYACMDSQSVNTAGKMNVSGWHATNGSIDRPYHYIIAFDPTSNREIARKNITNHQYARPDVQQVHNVNNAGYSGFNTTFDLSGKLANLSKVQIISRYSADAAGNSNNSDYWFVPFNIDRSNNASLDGVAVKDNQLQVTGWHATNLAADKPYHYIIMFDRTLGKEIVRQKIVDNIRRPDVAKVYPSVYNANLSGFLASFPLKKFNFNHQIQVIDRYSKSADGNSWNIDYWFVPIINNEYDNIGSLDGYNISDPEKLTVEGWHANDISKFENNHFLILFDNTTNRQVEVVSPKINSRPDVASAFPKIKTAQYSGFTGSFDLSSIKLAGGHTYSIVSRYSTSNTGNGGDGQYTDYWFKLPTFNQHAYYIDSQHMTEQGLEISGWMISNYAINHHYPYLILLNNGKEIGRQLVTLFNRPDVGKVYPHIYGSKISGFSTLIKINNLSLANGKLSVILRFSADPSGNHDYDDQYTSSYDTNQGSFDKISVDPYTNTLFISGWHASNQSVGKNYQYLIFLDQQGKELYRHRVVDINRSRPDVSQQVGYLINSDRSGYQLSFLIPNSIKRQHVNIIHRLTDDIKGNGNFIDIYYNNFFVNSGATLYRDAVGSIVGAFNNAEVICQNPELPTGCEMTAVTMMLRYAGCNVNKFQVANETPRSSNGNYGFVGNPYSTSGWWVFPTGIAPVVQRHLGTSQVMTGCSLQAIKDKLNLGHLVVVWMANMNGFVNHAITLTGYNGGGFTYNNPWTGRKESMSYGEFYGHWNADAQRALSY